MLKTPTILLVDDHQLIRETWVMLLKQKNKYDILLDTGNVEQAMDVIRHKKPSVVLLDINMMPLNGFDMLKMIRHDSPDTKVIAVSMHSEPAYARKMFLSGAKGYVTKNSTSVELMNSIDEVIAGNIYICAEVKDILSRELFEDQSVNIINSLTDRELEVTENIRTGLASKEIAVKMGISLKTVEVHRHHILKKLKVRNAAELMQLLSRNAM